MPDVFSKKKRSEVMRSIRSRGNRGTELVMARILRGLGITGWRRHVAIGIRKGVECAGGGRKTPGARHAKTTAKARQCVRPDFVFRQGRVALFVDGCFWHACPVHATKPRGNAAFWREKLARNQARDRLVTRMLRTKGWKVIRIWEHELAVRQRAKLEQKLRRGLGTRSVFGQRSQSGHGR